jgi:hypothetical protein
MIKIFPKTVLPCSLGCVFGLGALIYSPPAFAVLGFEVTPQEIDRIVVIGLESQVQLLGQPGAAKLKVTGIDESSEPGHYALERKDRVLFIKMQEYGDKSEWKAALAHPKTKRILEFAGASVPVEIQLREGQVIAQKWSRDLKVSMTRGKFTSTGGTGPLNVQLLKGDVLIQDQTSKVSVDMYRGQLTVKNLQGDLDGSVFAGGMTVEKSKGFLNINTTQSVARILQSAGTLQFENVKGNVITQQFAGRVDGQTGEGAVNIGIVPDTDVHIKSISGRVTVQTVTGSGASVNLVTAEGEITAPNEVPQGKSATEKTARGRLRGGEQKGSIVVRSREGSIVVK